MKTVYISSSLKNKKQVQFLKRAFKKEQVEMIFDWTLKKHDKTNKAKLARQELDGVLNCDLLVAVPPFGRGAYMEIGIAAAMKKPVVIVITQDNEELVKKEIEPFPIFFYTENVKICYCFKEYQKSLNSIVKACYNYSIQK